MTVMMTMIDMSIDDNLTMVAWIEVLDCISIASVF